MEILKNRYGLERSIERINLNKIRVMGESQFVRKSKAKDGRVVLFDFEGGPVLTVGGKIWFEKMSWKIRGINQLDTGYRDLYECVLDVDPIY